MSNINWLDQDRLLDSIPFSGIGAGDPISSAFREVFATAKGEADVLLRYKRKAATGAYLSPPTYQIPKWLEGASSTFLDPSESDSYHEKMTSIITKYGEINQLLLDIVAEAANPAIARA